MCCRLLLGGYTIFRRAPLCLSVAASLYWVFACIKAAAEMPQLEFSLKPQLCVLSEQEESCFDELQVSWRAPQKMSLCLYQGELDTPLKCWYGAQGGQHQFLLSATQNVVFHLRASDDNTLMTEAFEVIHERKDYRRQRRNPWSFF